MSLHENRYCLFAVVAAGVFISTLDSSMVNIALPTIMREFDSSLAKTEWVVLIYLLTVTVTLLCWGHLSDRLGRARVYSSGLLTFAAGSLACAYSPDLGSLLLSRFAQAMGAAMMMSTGPAVIKESFPAEQLGRFLGLIGVSASLGLMAGPSLGGFIIQFYSWRSIFLITVPIGLLFAVLARFVLPGMPAAQRDATPKQFDFKGAATWVIALTMILLAVTHATSPSWSMTRLLLFFLSGVVALFSFIRLETTARDPILPVFLFKKQFFRSAIICSIISFMALFSVLILTPFYLDQVLALSALQVGLVMMAIPVSVLVLAPMAGWLSDRIGARYVSTLGLLVAAGGILALSALSSESAPFQVAVRLAIVGCGQAIFLAPNSASVLSRVVKEQAGTAAAMLATARNLGMLLGIAQAGLIFSFCFRHLTGGLDLKDFSMASAEPFMLAYRWALLAAAGLGISGALVSWRREVPEQKQNSEVSMQESE